MGCLCEEIAEKDVVTSSVCIGHLWIFENLKTEELTALTENAFRKAYGAGERIFFQGESATQMFLIKAGRVKLSKVLEEGAEITLDIRKAGDFLGEYVLSEEIDYPVSAHAIENTLTCGFTKEHFEKLVLDHPNIGLQVIRNLSTRISSLTSRVGDLSIPNLAERLYSVLSTVAHEHGTETKKGYSIPFPLTHEELSFLVGAHRVTITRAIKELKDQGKLLQEGRRLIIY